MANSSLNFDDDNNNCSNHNNDHGNCLLDDIIQEILLRLPVKCLIRFKCVCKSWFSLISDPDFAETHFNRALSPPSHRLLYIPLSSSFKLCSIDIDASLHHHSTVTLPNTNNLNLNQSRLRIRASCRGFVLIDYFYSLNLILWNPSTGSHKTLPYPPGVSHRLVTLCIGYDLATDDYLVTCFALNDTFPKAFGMKIFSVRANSWGEISIEDEPDERQITVLHTDGLFLNGVIHWLQSYRPIVILCFDLRLRKFSHLDVPDAVRCKTNRLMALGGCLALCNSNEIWVMKEYKVHPSWTKYNDVYKHGVLVRHVNNAGEMIGFQESKGGGTIVMKLNGNGEELERRKLLSDTFGVRRVLYMESLFSLPEK